jgi:hypothetical protein
VAPEPFTTGAKAPAGTHWHTYSRGEHTTSKQLLLSKGDRSRIAYANGDDHSGDNESDKDKEEVKQMIVDDNTRHRTKPPSNVRHAREELKKEWVNYPININELRMFPSSQSVISTVQILVFTEDSLKPHLQPAALQEQSEFSTSEDLDEESMRQAEIAKSIRKMHELEHDIPLWEEQ